MNFIDNLEKSLTYDNLNNDKTPGILHLSKKHVFRKTMEKKEEDQNNPPNLYKVTMPFNIFSIQSWDVIEIYLCSI